MKRSAAIGRGLFSLAILLATPALGQDDDWVAGHYLDLSLAGGGWTPHIEGELQSSHTVGQAGIGWHYQRPDDFTIGVQLAALSVGPTSSMSELDVWQGWQSQIRAGHQWRYLHGYVGLGLGGLRLEDPRRWVDEEVARGSVSMLSPVAGVDVALASGRWGRVTFGAVTQPWLISGYSPDELHPGEVAWQTSAQLALEMKLGSPNATLPNRGIWIIHGDGLVHGIAALARAGAVLGRAASQVAVSGLRIMAH